LREAANKKNLGLIYEEPGFLPLVAINERGIREALYNIIDNGIKYTEQGGVTIKSSLAGKYVLVSISDTGIGMKEVDSLGLFKRTFDRGDKAREINTTGKGIGLYLAGQMIFANGGNIWVISGGKNAGATFFIELPVVMQVPAVANKENGGKTNTLPQNINLNSNEQSSQPV
jgi:signal transduction histidine kinase